MNDLSPDDFGEKLDLLKALGLVDENGEFERDWLRNPQEFLKKILSDESQRQALLSFVATVREGEIERDEENRQWVPLFDKRFDNGALIKLYIIVDDTPADQVHLFLGLRFETDPPLVPSTSSVMIPLFRIGKGSAVSPIELIGQQGGKVAVKTEVQVQASAPNPGEAGVRKVGLRVLIPTKSDDGDVDIALTLIGLQLPGESSGRDIELSILEAQDLKNEAISLLVSLIQAQMNGPEAEKLLAFAKMLGLANDPVIPSLPLTGRVEDLGDWLAQVFGSPDARSSWLGALADLFGNGATVNGGEIELPLGQTAGAPKVTIGLRVEAGASGRPVVTVSAAAGSSKSVEGRNVEAAFRSDLIRIDLGTRQAIALPSLQADIRIDVQEIIPANSNISVDTLVIGFGLNEDRKPIFILELLNATVVETNFPRLDLTNPDAVTAAGQQVATDALNQVLSNLAPIGDLIGVFMGIQSPSDASQDYPVGDLLTFLSDPLGTLNSHWRDVLENHVGDVPKVLADLRRLISNDDTATAISGAGTDLEPWKLALNAGVYLAVWQDSQGRLLIGMGFNTSIDNFGAHCTVIETKLRVAIVSIDLSSGQTGIFPEIVLRALARARGGGPLEIGAGAVKFKMDYLGGVFRWTPETKLQLSHEMPNPIMYLDDINIPFQLPDFNGSFEDLLSSLTNDHWMLIETLITRLADALSSEWLRDLIETLGWRKAAPVIGQPRRHRLKLSEIVKSSQRAQAEIKRWLMELLGDVDIDLTRHLQPLARLFSGEGDAFLTIDGQGTVRDPWRLTLAGASNRPALAVWRQPDTPLPRPNAVLTQGLRRWSPGKPGLDPHQLAAAIGSEFPELFSAIDDLGLVQWLDEALPALAQRWQGGDGVVVPPTGSVAGTTIHISANETANEIMEDIDLNVIFGATPTTVIHVSALDETKSLPAGLDPEHVLDMRDSTRSFQAYSPLPQQSGNWYVILPPLNAAGGISDQVNRLRHALVQISGQADATILAAPSAGHAAWQALEAMGDGLNRLVCVGLPVTAAQVPAGLSLAEGEILRRLAEIIPQQDAEILDDIDLVTARKLIASYLETEIGIADLDLPAGWNTAHRASLDVHLVYGVMSQSRVSSAMTAMVAAGLSLHAQARNVQRGVLDLTSASFGVHLPIESSAPSGLQLKGSVLTEIIGVDLDLENQSINPRSSRLISMHALLRDSSGWLVGGPSSAQIPLDAELRAIEMELQTTVGGRDTPNANQAKVILHGARLNGLAYPRLTLTLSPLGELGIDGATAPSLPQVLSLLETVFKGAKNSSNLDPEIARFLEALSWAKIIDVQANIDSISLTNWLDDPSARVRELLGDAGDLTTLKSMISGITNNIDGINFDQDNGRLSIAITGSTGYSLIDEWSIGATISSTGVSNASVRLGAVNNSHVSIGLTPFVMSLELSEQDAAAAGGLARLLPLWPAPDVAKMMKAAAPKMVALALSETLTELRNIEPMLASALDGLLNALGLLQGPSNNKKVNIPLLLLVDPGKWLREVSPIAGIDGNINPQKAIVLLEALKPLTGFSGASGTWNISTGIALRVRADSGRTVVEFVIDENSFMNPNGNSAFVCGGSIGIAIAAHGQIQPAVSLFTGLSRNTNGRRAVHFTVTGNMVRLFLRDVAGSDLELYPTPANFAQFAGAMVTAALPQVLDAIEDTDTSIGTMLKNIGIALGVRGSEENDNFDGAELVAWGSNPVGQLSNNWGRIVSAVLQEIEPFLPNGVTVAPQNTPNSLKVSKAPVNLTVTFNNNPDWVSLNLEVTNLPVVETIDADIRFDQNGLVALSGKIGPAQIPLGDVATLRPIAGIKIDPDLSNEDKVYAGLSVDELGNDALEAAYIFGGNGAFQLRLGNSTDPVDIASTLLRFVIDLMGGLLFELPAIKSLLETEIGGQDVRDLFRGVILSNDGSKLDSDLFRFAKLKDANGVITESDVQFIQSKLARVYKLIDNIFGLGISFTIDNAVTISLTNPDGVAGVGIGLTDRFTLVDGDVSLWLENDNKWIINPQPAGINIGLIRFDNVTNSFELEPVLSVDGVGLRVGGRNKPLVERPISIGSIALHLFARINGFADTPELLGGVQVQVSELAVAVSGGDNNSNPVAAGLLSETSNGAQGLAPSFSPALSIQSGVIEQPEGSNDFVPTGEISLDFRAGDGEGPWWLPIRKQFGPLYVGQIGVGRQKDGNSLKTISVLFDGEVSIAGLKAAVDDLELKHTVDHQGGIFDPESWSVDLKGLAIAADISGISLSGGLRKFEEPPNSGNIEYIGMLNARFATYGLSIYGGYAEVAQTPSYTSFFAYGAVLGPFGGPPAFFLTGVGGGLGINRKINPPTNMDQFNGYPLITALDPVAASLPPMEALERIRNVIQNERGSFWFAAGVSFTSFALVDGIAVVVVQLGNGFELSIFGLARAALPKPDVALVSIELGLVARFSASEGVMWIQAQLTENSWLLHPSARLTGGFAFVSWFKGDKAGEFVLTLGGYHPNFSRNGYPNVPRIGFNWSVSSKISIKATTYFALTSEAIMTGGQFEASAKFGAAYANLSFGGNALVFFDPFSYEADAHARVSAGIRIKTIFGTARLSFSLGAEIEVRGPEFHGSARVEVGPIDIRVSFGDSSPVQPSILNWRAFTEKYLELAPGNRAQALSGIAGKGALPPKSSGNSEASVPDGTASRPYEMASEFELAISTTIPFIHLQKAKGSISRTELVSVDGVKPNLDIAPSAVHIEDSTLVLTLRRVGDDNEEFILKPDIEITPRRTGRFPIGVWGPTPDPDNKKIPKGEMIKAAEGVDIKVETQLVQRIPTQGDGIAFNRVEAGERKHLPLRADGSLRRAIVRQAKNQRDLIAQLDSEQLQQIGERWFVNNTTPAAASAWHRERIVPMRVGLLSERVVASSRKGIKRKLPKPRKVFELHTFGKAQLAGVIHQDLRVQEDTLVGQTRVLEGSALARNKPRMAPIRMNPQKAPWMSEAILIRSQAKTPIKQNTVVAKGQMPMTLAASSRRSVSKQRSSMADKRALLELEQSVNRQGGRETQRLGVGEIAVFDLPGARQSIRFPTAGQVNIAGGSARVLALGAGGRVMLDHWDANRIRLPSGVRSFAVIAGDKQVDRDISGWLEGTKVAYLGHQMALCAGALIRAEGASRTRGGKHAGTGWMAARELTDQSALIETRFDVDAQTVAVLLDGAVTESDLAELSVRISGRVQADDQPPRLVPISGKTLIIYSLPKRDGKGPLSVTVAGRADARLDGILSARISGDALVGRLMNNNFALEIAAIGQGNQSVSIRYQAPAALRTFKEI